MSESGNGDSRYEMGAWQLDDLFPGIDSPEVQQTLTSLDAQVEAFAARRGDLSPDIDAATFLGFIDDYEAIVRQGSRLAGYASLRFSADTQDQKAQTFYAQMQQLVADVSNRILFFTLWWKELDEENVARLLAESDANRYWLESLQRERPYTLAEDEEKIINLKNVNGVQALNTLYEAITNRYTFRLEVDGEEKELTRGELGVYVRDPDPDLRAASYQELLRVYAEDEPILGQIYQARVRDWRSEHVNLRGHNSPLAVRNLANDIPDAVVDTLLDVSEENAPLFQRFFRLKARWLGMDKLRRYDVYAPVAATDKRYAFGEAVELVLESYRQFDDEVATLAQRVLDEQHLDSEVRKGKRSGAFCATVVPDLTPYVLQSYQGRPTDVSTLAHELGHAVHSMLSAHHTALTHHPSLPLAETASTFGEMLLVDRLLELEDDPAVRRTLLFQQMDDAYAVIQRQAFFTLFERAAHEAIQEGAAVSDLSDLYFENVKEQFGDALSISDDFRHEWVAIPHFYKVPFYVYAYAFGQLLVLSLYQQYREEGDAFRPRYLDILRAGGAAAPAVILQRAGIDIDDASFWQGGFDVLGDLVTQLEELPAPASAP